jgi:hypothetical protein
MTTLVRRFLSLEAAVFGSAALVHAGMLVRGYEHSSARTAESVIALVLLVGLVASFVMPESSRGIGLGAQGFALLGTGVGIITIVIGVGPRTALDLSLHVAMVVLLVAGLVVIGRQTQVSTNRASNR